VAIVAAPGPAPSAGSVALPVRSRSAPARSHLDRSWPPGWAARGSPTTVTKVSTALSERGRTGHVAWARTSERPDVLLLHGFTDAAACWEPVASALADRWGVLATDARGHGESGLPEEPFGRMAHARDAAFVLDAEPGVGPEGVIVVGHSMGAGTAAALAQSRPDLVRALVLEDPPPGQPRQTSGEVRRRTMPEWLRAARDRDLAERIARCRMDNPDWPEDELEPWAVSKEQFDTHVFDLPAEAPAYLPEVLAKVTCPVLLIHGDTDRGSLIPPQTAAACAMSAAGDFEVARIDGAGHSVRRDRRGPYLAALTGFLERHTHT
jgi:pimeloyl-ACP methyl ester carboxylesterase